MTWSWKIARIAGIDVYVHATFLILIAWLGVVYWQASGTLAGVAYGIGFILALFVCVVLHEYGHALTARRFGIRTRYITLLPIGGVAMLEKMPDDPKQEIIVALAGPAVNFVIALGLWLWLSLGEGEISFAELTHNNAPFIERLILINLILALFNLLPAFPMDGGRVLRAALNFRMKRTVATRMAANVGQALALVFGLIGLLYNPFLIFIALFVWIGAEAEANAVQIKSVLDGMTVSRAMAREFKTLAPGDKLARVIEETLAGTQKDFPVLENSKVIGVLTQAGLLKGLQKYGENGLVADSMDDKICSVNFSEALEPLLEKLQAGDCKAVPVMKSGRLIGIVDLDNINELLRIQMALQEH